MKSRALRLMKESHKLNDCAAPAGPVFRVSDLRSRGFEGLGLRVQDLGSRGSRGSRVWDSGFGI